MSRMMWERDNDFQCERLFCPIPSIRRLSRCSSEPSSILRGAGKQNRVWWNSNKRLNSPDVWEKKVVESNAWTADVPLFESLPSDSSFSSLLYNILLRLDSFYRVYVQCWSNISQTSDPILETSLRLQLDVWLRSRVKWIVPTFQTTVEKLWCVCFPPLLPRPSNYCLTLLERSYEWCVYEYNASSPRFN